MTFLPERRVAYLGNLARVAAFLEKTEGVRLAAWLVEEGDPIVEEDAWTPACPARRVKDRASVQKNLALSGPLDLGVIVNFGVILSEENIASAAKGFVNVHFGLLPGNPGRHPIEGALRIGEEVTGLTLHRVTPEPDGGPVLDVRRMSVGARRDPVELFFRMIEAVPGLLSDRLPELLR